MPASLQELKEKRDLLYNDMTALQDRADAEGRELSADEQGKFDENRLEIEKTSRQIKNREDLVSVGAIVKAAGRVTDPQPPLNDNTIHNPKGVEAHHIVTTPTHFRHKALKSFKGDKAEETAFRAGKFFLAAIYRDESARLWCREHGIELLAQGTNVNTAGGVLVPEEFESQIVDLRETYGVARQNCRIEPMTSDAKMVPRRTSGLTAYFVDENPSSAITESSKAWDSVKLVNKKLATLTRYSTEIGEDAVIDLGDDLASEIALNLAA